MAERADRALHGGSERMIHRSGCLLAGVGREKQLVLVVEHEAVLVKGGIIQELADVILRPFDIARLEITQRIIPYNLTYRTLLYLDDLVRDTVGDELLLAFLRALIHPKRQIISANE